MWEIPSKFGEKSISTKYKIKLYLFYYMNKKFFCFALSLMSNEYTKKSLIHFKN